MGVDYRIVGVLQQLDWKMKDLSPLNLFGQPEEGWIRLLRKALNMSLKQLGKKMSITPQSVSDMEKRELEGAISLKAMNEAAEALDMKMVYAFIPKDGSLEKMIEKRAYELATQIVNRTSMTMVLEDQAVYGKQQEAINELANDIKREMPKTLWD